MKILTAYHFKPRKIKHCFSIYLHTNHIFCGLIAWRCLHYDQRRIFFNVNRFKSGSLVLQTTVDLFYSFMLKKLKDYLLFQEHHSFCRLILFSSMVTSEYLKIEQISIFKMPKFKESAFKLICSFKSDIGCWRAKCICSFTFSEINQVQDNYYFWWLMTA